MPGTGNWHPSTDHLAGTTVYGDPNDDEEAWSVKFDDLCFEEMVFTFVDKSKWLLTTKDAVNGEYYGNEDRDIL